MAYIRKENPPINLVPDAVLKALAEQRGVVESSDLLASLISQWGGIDQLALDIRTEFTNGQTGGMVRARILELFSRLIITATDREHQKALRPSDLSDAELHKYAAAYFAKLKETDDGGGQLGTPKVHQDSRGVRGSSPQVGEGEKESREADESQA